jgi:hypothetical protein
VAKPHHTRRAAIRGSVSTPIPRGRINLDRLLAKTGISEVTLNNLRERYPYVIPRPLVVPLATGRGSASFYPPKTVGIINRLNELRLENPNPDECLWRLYLEGHPVDIRGWASERTGQLGQWAAETYGNNGGDTPRKTALAFVRFLKGRVRNVERLSDLLDWSVSAAAGDDAAGPNLSEPGGPPILHTVAQATGMPAPASLPSPVEAKLIMVLVELMHLQRQTEIAGNATDKEVEWARQQLRAADRIIAAIKIVDWNSVWPIIEPFFPRAKPEPPSWRARKAKRKRPLGAPAFVGPTLKTWRRFDARAWVFAALIDLGRRDPLWRKAIPELLAFIEAGITTFAGLPILFANITVLLRAIFLRLPGAAP